MTNEILKRIWKTELLKKYETEILKKYERQQRMKNRNYAEYKRIHYIKKIQENDVQRWDAKAAKDFMHDEFNIYKSVNKFLEFHTVNCYTSRRVNIEIYCSVPR